MCFPFDGERREEVGRAQKGEMVDDVDAMLSDAMRAFDAGLAHFGTEFCFSLSLFPTNISLYASPDLC